MNYVSQSKVNVLSPPMVSKNEVLVSSFRFAKLGSIPAKHCNRCKTWLFVVCKTSIRILMQFDHRSREIGGIVAESNECEARLTWNG